jgi:hypothetical protein
MKAVYIGDRWLSWPDGSVSHRCTRKEGEWIVEDGTGQVFEIKVGRERMSVCSRCKARPPKNVEMILYLRRIL